MSEIKKAGTRFRLGFGDKVSSPPTYRPGHLSTEDLERELAEKRGDAGWRKAVRAELKRRSKS